MKSLGRNTNSLIRTAWAAALREKTTRKKRLTDRARTFKKLGLDIQKNMRRPAAGAFFHLTSPFIGHVTWMTLRRRGVLARDRCQHELMPEFSQPLHEGHSLLFVLAQKLLPVPLSQFPLKFFRRPNVVV